MYLYYDDLYYDIIIIKKKKYKIPKQGFISNRNQEVSSFVQIVFHSRSEQPIAWLCSFAFVGQIRCRGTQQ